MRLWAVTCENWANMLTLTEWDWLFLVTLWVGTGYLMYKSRNKA
jgi:hypothetical protein